MSNDLRNIHPIHSVAPVADGFAATKAGDVFRLTNLHEAHWLVYRGVGTTGTTVVTVQACDDVTPSNNSAVAFWYRTNVATDVWGDWTAATSAGFTLAAGSNFMAQVYIPVAALPAGYSFARLVCTEGVDDPVLGGVLFLGGPQRFSKDAPATKIA